MIDETKLVMSYRHTPLVSQKVEVTCDECGSKFTIKLASRIFGLKKYGKDFCRSCKQKLQYKEGLRENQKKTCRKNAALQKGKTFEEIYGSKKSKEIKEKLSKAFSGKNNPMYGRNDQCYGALKENERRKGKTLEESFGEEKAKEIKEKLSKAFSGKNNPMYGKPAPEKSGTGWSGHYKNYYFRSLLELSFILSHPEVESAETLTIPYKLDGKDFTYHPDFIDTTNKILYEIKPKNLLNMKRNLEKFKVGKLFAESKGFIFKVLTEEDIKKITYSELQKLVNIKEVKLDKRYINKLQEVTR